LNGADDNCPPKWPFQQGKMMDQHGSTMDQPWILMIFGDSHLSIASPRSCADVLPDLAAGVDFTANASGAEIHRVLHGISGKIDREKAWLFP
jgi:hypothetical protein